MSPDETEKQIEIKTTYDSKLLIIYHSSKPVSNIEFIFQLRLTVNC